MARKLFFICILLSAILVSACESELDTGQERFKQFKELRLGLAMQPSSALLIIAEKKGYFLQHGLKIHIKQFSSGKRALNVGLLKSKVDVISLAESPFVLASFKNKSLRTFAGIYTAENTNSIVARRDLGIQFPVDLNGKRIATQKASTVHYFMHQFFIENGIDISGLDVSFYKAEELVDKLVKGEIDAFSMREPYVSQARKLLQDKAVVFQESGVYIQKGLLVADENYIYRNRETIRRLLKALYQAEQYIRHHRFEAVKIIAAYIGVENQVFANEFGQSEAKLSLDQLYINIAEDIARWAIMKGYAENEMPNYLQRVVSEPLREVVPDAVTLIDS